MIVPTPREIKNPAVISLVFAGSIWENVTRIIYSEFMISTAGTLPPGFAIKKRAYGVVIYVQLGEQVFWVWGVADAPQGFPFTPGGLTLRSLIHAAQRSACSDPSSGCQEAFAFEVPEKHAEVWVPRLLSLMKINW